MNKFLLIFLLTFSSLFASDVIHQRQESMQDFNKLMRSATQILNSGESQGLEEIYIEIEAILLKYPTLFPDDSFDLSLIHISEPTRLLSISYAVFCLKKKKTTKHQSTAPIPTST